LKKFCDSKIDEEIISFNEYFTKKIDEKIDALEVKITKDINILLLKLNETDFHIIELSKETKENLEHINYLIENNKTDIAKNTYKINNMK
jgi:hypothetical protein